MDGQKVADAVVAFKFFFKQRFKVCEDSAIARLSAFEDTMLVFSLDRAEFFTLCASIPVTQTIGQATRELLP